MYKEEGEKTILSFSFINKTDTDIEVTNGGKDIEYGKANLAGLRYHKQLYSPNILDATLEFSNQNAREKMLAVSQLLSGLNASLDVIDITEEEGPKGYVYSQSESGISICKGYVVGEVQPNFSVAAAKKMFVELKIYSPDKALDDFEFSKAYTGESLGSNILAKGVKAIMPDAPVKTDTSGMRVLKIAGSEESDLVQPYLVQYNETFHNFLSRIANRCGEFLYYEGDALSRGGSAQERLYPVRLRQDILQRLRRRQSEGCRFQLQLYERQKLQSALE